MQSNLFEFKTGTLDCADNLFDIHRKDDIDKLRKILYNTEKKCHKYGLPKWRGTECCDVNDVKEYISKSSRAFAAFKESVEMHLIFYMAYYEFEGTPEQFTKKETDECASRICTMWTRFFRG